MAHSDRYLIKSAFLRSAGRKPNGDLAHRLKDDLFFLQFVLECGSFHVLLPRNGGLQCQLQVFSEFEDFPDSVWRAFTRMSEPYACWTTIAGAAGSTRGIRISTKESATGFAAFLLELEPIWREDVWRAWASATALYGHGPTFTQRRMARLKTQQAVRLNPPTPVVRWLADRKLIA